VNNLAVVTSIEYGVFGLAFFIYTIGSSIDQIFFREALPSPTFGTGGLFWASLTLAVMNLPVVIVSTEERLSRTRPIYALGWFKTVGGAGDDLDSNAAVREKLAAWKQDRAGLVERFDADGDGDINMQEWETARQAAEAEVREEQLQRALKPGVNVFCMPPKHHDNLFLLSAVPQAQLVSRYRKGAIVCVVLFLVTGAVAAWLVGARYTGL